MKAVILAGGKGTRVSRIAEGTPKPMLPVGGRPLLSRQIELLKRYGIREIIIITHHLAAAIENHFKDGEGLGVEITYFRESSPLGTTGGLKEIEDRLKSDFLLLYGDVMADMDLSRLIKFHLEKKSDFTLVLHPNDHPHDSDLVEIDGSKKVTAVYPKPRPEGSCHRNLVNAGIYAAGPGIFRHLKKGIKEDFGKDVLKKLVTEASVYGYVTAEYLKDIGTPERLKEVNRDFESGKIGRLNIENKRKAVFMDRDGVINEEIDFLCRKKDMKLIAGAAEGIKEINGSEFLAVVATNQSVIARNMCTPAELERIHAKMETLLGEKGARLDAIYYCPHHPDKGWPGENPAYKKDCSCRKPKTGMITAAAADFNIDLPGSFLIGDSSRDIICGKNSGMTTIAVRTGKGCRQTDIEPDYFFENLREAASFITGGQYAGLFKEISAGFQASAKKPFVISIGGNARSGKSTLVGCLSSGFAKAGEKVLKISLDDWLLPLDARNGTRNVFERFQLSKIEKDLAGLLEGKAVTLKKYDSFLRGAGEKEAALALKDESVVIIEGVVALSSAAVRGLCGLKIFCDIGKKLLESRVKSYYAWKGLSPEEGREIFSSRISDEYDLIEKDSGLADIVVHAEKPR